MEQLRNQISIVAWKHYKIRKRHFIFTCLEVAVPVVIFILVAYARSNLPSATKEYVPETIMDPISDTMLSTTINTRDTRLLYTPRNNFTYTITREVQLKLSMNVESIIGFDNKESLMGYYKEIDDEEITVLICFDGVDKDLPSKLDYDLQIYDQTVDWQTDRLYRNDIGYIPGAGSHLYLGNQFLAFQWAIDTSFIELVTKAPLNVPMVFTEFPYPAHWTDDTNNKFLNFLPLLTMLSFIFLFPSILKIIVSEKASGMKQLMQMNGLKSTTYWFGWYVNAFSLCCVSGVIIAILLTHKLFHEEYAPLQHVDLIQLVSLLFLFCSATITFIFVFSIIFKQATLAMLIGIIVWILSYNVYVKFANNMEILPLYVKIAASLLPHIALYYGFEVIAIGEIRGRTVGFAEAPRGSTSEDMTMQIVFIMLVVDTLLYLLITVLCETDPLGKYILSKLGRNMVKKHKDDTYASEELLPNVDDNKIEKCDDVPLLEIRNLTLHYNNKIKAVNNLNLTIYKGDLMVLLGHNGAGKTTTLSILAGLLKETSGSIIINDVQDVANLKNRQFVSICPQANMLFPELSIEEHLIFFGKLKGMNSTKIKENVEDLLENKLKLSHKRHELPKHLSGGMKRKLCIAIALMATPTLVILDEPTAGIDTEGCRDVWDMILSSKHESTFIISTHLMEEVEMFANRVAIMTNGKLVCYGSPMFLKNLYNVGYRIELECANKEELLNVGRDLGKCVNLWKKDENHLVGEYCIPNKQQNKLPGLLKKLEHSKKNSTIKNYNISAGSFEDIFIKSLESEKQTQNDHFINYNESGNQDDINLSIPFYKELYNKFLLILSKKLKFVERTGSTWFIMVLLFYLLVILTFALSDIGYSNGTKGGKTIMLNLETYGHTKVPYNMYSNDQLANIFNDYVMRSSSTPCPTDNISALLVREALKNIVEYNTKYVSGVEMTFEGNTGEVNVLYSNQAIHGAPISLNLATNTILKYLSGNSSYTIKASHSSLRATKTTKHQTNISLADNILLWTFVLPAACLFAIIMFTALPTLERKNLIITISRICQFPSYLYWIINYIIDAFTYIVIISLPVMVLGFLSCLDIIMLNNENIGHFVIIFVWYGLVMIPYGYIISFWEKSAATVFIQFLIPNMSLSPIITCAILSLQTSGNTLLSIFAVFNPHIILTYAMSMFCIKMVQNHNWDILPEEQKQIICHNMQYPCCDPQSVECSNERSYDQPVEYFKLSIMASFFLMIAIIMMDSSLPCNSKYHSSETVAIENLKKSYRKLKNMIFKGEPIEAVKNLSFTVLKGEIFGLLGINGAGKSTSFKLITRQESPNEGSIRISNKIGYCPQDNAMIKCFTGEELLTYFGKLRNFHIPKEEIDELLIKTGLYEYRNQPCGTYSGGNKRKLNTCIALIGNPDVVALDEPTTGVDPESRRKLRDVLMGIKLRKRTAIILSSHSMEDCEKLCDKLGIMKKGVIQTGEIRTVTQLKENYNIGHIVQIKTNDNRNINSILKTMMVKFKGFPNVETLEKRNGLLTIRIINSNWIEILEELEYLKNLRTDISDYTVKQASLEDVFLGIARDNSI